MSIRRDKVSRLLKITQDKARDLSIQATVYKPIDVKREGGRITLNSQGFKAPIFVQINRGEIYCNGEDPVSLRCAAKLVDLYRSSRYQFTLVKQ